MNTLAQQLYDTAFHPSREPRSDAYKKGVLAALRYRASSTPIICKYIQGTAEHDAFNAGCIEGHAIWEEHRKTQKVRPSKIIPGTKLIIASHVKGLGSSTAYFVKRVPAQGGQKAKNLLRFPAFVGLNGPDDEGVCEMSDYDLSRRGHTHETSRV